MMTRALVSLSLFALLLYSPLALTKSSQVDALVVIDIDGTLGEQEKVKPAFSDGTVAKVVPADDYGDFYYYPGVMDFMKTVFKWKQEAAASGKIIEVALFTMGSGHRNEVVRDFIEDKLALKRNTVRVFDYSTAVFSDQVISMWRAGDPALSKARKEFLDSLHKPLKTAPLEDNVLYKKDLGELLQHYKGLALKNIVLIDDNDQAVPSSQNNQLIVIGKDADYKPVMQKLQLFVAAL